MANVEDQRIPYKDQLFYTTQPGDVGGFPVVQFSPIPAKIKIRLRMVTFLDGSGIGCTQVLFFTPVVFPVNVIAAFVDYTGTAGNVKSGSQVVDVILQGPTTIKAQLVSVTAANQSWGFALWGEYLEMGSGSGAVS
ncbi:MAG TPA: hypothetical protein VFA06_04060 [Actinocrinis sp.]|jgi:hypothetical protein|uniref:hypothetical protein n=1 Tax=Actinocrinis sp. TaxID=1920516 RepID=UPI002D2B5384|nr:hypothetical protein [Actinocrinis sp.]HZU55023.1 hypothetical protein [Actinocrinis sp.]